MKKFITAAKRTAVGSLGKSLKNISAEDFGSVVISSLLKNQILKMMKLMKLFWVKF